MVTSCVCGLVCVCLSVCLSIYRHALNEKENGSSYQHQCRREKIKGQKLDDTVFKSLLGRRGLCMSIRVLLSFFLNIVFV